MASSNDGLAAYIALPLRLPSLPSLPASLHATAHHLYLRPQAPELRRYVPNLVDSDFARSVYASNIPFDATESSLRCLFSEQLGGSKIERVEFCVDDIVQGAYSAVQKRRRGAEEGVDSRVVPTVAEDQVSRGKKRKRRQEDDSLEVPEAQLPGVADEELMLRSGACAVLVFVDRSSADAAIKACKKAAGLAKKRNEVLLEWDSGRTFGLDYLKKQHQQKYPPHSELLRSATEYLSRYDRQQDSLKRAQNRARTVPDEEGFVTVARGGRAGPAKLEQANEALKKELEKRERNKAEGFYRFQFREKAKERERELRKKFEQDVKTVERMRQKRRGKSWRL